MTLSVRLREVARQLNPYQDGPISSELLTIATELERQEAFVEAVVGRIEEQGGYEGLYVGHCTPSLANLVNAYRAYKALTAAPQEEGS